MIAAPLVLSADSKASWVWVADIQQFAYTSVSQGYPACGWHLVAVTRPVNMRPTKLWTWKLSLWYVLAPLPPPPAVPPIPAACRGIAHTPFTTPPPQLPLGRIPHTLPL